jgi:hypothetical protein
MKAAAGESAVYLDVQTIVEAQRTVKVIEATGKWRIVAFSHKKSLKVESRRDACDQFTTINSYKTIVLTNNLLNLFKTLFET